MDQQPGPSQPRPDNSDSGDYSLEVTRLDVVRKLSKKRQLYVLDIKINNASSGTIHIGDDGRPSSDAVLSFAQLGASSVFEISFRKSTNSDGHHLGHVLIEEDVRELLGDSIPYEFERDLLGSRQHLRLFGKEKPMTTGTISVRLNMTDSWKRAEHCVSMAERQVEKIRAMADKASLPDSVIGTVIQAVDQIKEIVDTVAEIHPLINLSWKAASALYNLVSHQFKADAKLVDLVDKMRNAFVLSGEADSLEDRTKELLRSKIKDILDESDSCSRFVQNYAAHSFAGRMARRADSEKIDEYAARFAALGEQLNSIIIVTIGKGVDNIGKGVDNIELRQALEVTDMSLSKQSGRSRCLQGTRKDYIDQIMSRLFPGTGVDQNIVWLTGAAGAGKSTIAATISDLCDAKGYPAAYLFFERGKDEYLSAIRAIAYRVAVLYTHILPHIVDAVKNNGNIIGSPLRTQFEKLLLEPIQIAVNRVQHPVVIILDALDECGASRKREDLVRLLTTEFKRLPSNVRVLVTSRPEIDITKHLSSKSNIHRIELEHSSRGSRQDVDAYIRVKMVETVGQGPPKGWEWDGVFGVLSESANGLFIWASTAIKMVAESSNPRRKLCGLLDDIRSVGGGIDSLYSTLLDQSGISWNEPDTKAEFTGILGVILFAKEALSGEDIEAFLGLEEGAANSVLSRLRSVLFYETKKPVRLHHASFADYLSSGRSGGKPWNVDELAQRLSIAERCFDVMNEKLCFNICGIKSSFQRNDDIPDLQDRVEKAISRHLDYACRFWPVHFCELSHPGSLLEKLEIFAYSKLLYWFEVLSATNQYNRIAGQALLNSTVKTATTDEDLSSFLWAAYKMAVAFAYPISRSAPHIYLSAISLWRGESRVADHYSTSHPIVKVKRYGKRVPTQCIKVLTGHTSWVFSVVFSSDGKRIVSGSHDKTVRIWDADSGEVVSGPFRHKEGVMSVAFSPDDRLVASGSSDGAVRVWGVDSGDPVLGPLKGHTDPVLSVTFSPDGKYIASGSWDKTIRVWDAESGESVGSPFEGHIGAINSIVFSRDGKLIASGSDDKTIRVWNAKSGKLVVRPFEDHADEVWSVDFSPDSCRIASGSKDKSIRMWDAVTGKQVTRPIEGHADAVNSVAFSPDGERIASGSYDGTICIWDARRGELVAGLFKGHSSSVRSVVFSPDGKRIASGSWDSAIRIWDAESGESGSDGSESLPGHVYSIAFSPDGKHIASGSEDHTIRVWEAETGELVSGPFKGHTDWVRSVAYSPDGKCIASGSDDKAVRIWDAGTGEPVSGPFEGHSDPVWSVAFSPNGKLVASGSVDKTIRVWDANNGRPVADPFTGHTGGVYSVSFSPDGKFIASGSGDKTIRVWDVDSGELVSGPFEGHTGWIRSISYSRDGALIASGSEDRTIRVWNAESGTPFRGPLGGHTGRVNTVAFSPNGKFIASGSEDESVCIWAIDSGQIVWGPLKGHTNWVWSVVFSPSGRYLASGSWDRTIRIWSLDNIEVGASSSSGRPSKITSFDHSPHVDKPRIISNWSLSNDGWVLGPGGELLTWIPEDMRSTLLRPENTAIIGQGFSWWLDFAGSPLGEDWCEGFPLTDKGTC